MAEVVTADSPECDVSRVIRAFENIADRLARVFDPVAMAIAEFSDTLAAVVDSRLASRGLTWDQVSHLPPDLLAEIVWGDPPPADEADRPTVLGG